MAPEREFTFHALDGFPLAATRFDPPSGADARPVVLAAPATAVKRGFYASFARHLAREGHPVVTWDMRGVGGSRPVSLRGFEATMEDWGAKDLAGAIAWAGREHPGRPLLLVGHSSGGWLAGLAPNADRLSALVLVAAGGGHWSLWEGADRYRYAALWYLAIPGLASAAGYLPGRFGLGSDLPKGVALQWARWFRSPHFVLSEGDRVAESYRRVTAPILAYSFADDGYAPPRAVESVLGLFPRAPKRVRRVSPFDVGAPVGHFGFYKGRACEALWKDLLENVPGLLAGSDPAPTADG